MKSIGRRRPGGGGGRSSSVFERVLCRRVEESCKNNNATVDQLVEHLRTTFPEYGRHKLQPFTKQVQQTIQRINNTPTPTTTTDQKPSNHDRPSTSTVNDDDGDCSTPFHSPNRKRMKKIDRSEERLRDMEIQHILKKQKGDQEDDHRHGPSTSASSSLSVSTSSSSDEAEDGAVSTSEDAVYGEKLEPEFDLMKSMLRTRYSGSKNAAKSKGTEEKNVELEVVNNKATKKVDFIHGDTIEAVGLNSGKSKGLINGNVEVKGKDGPRFKDLGGMAAVVEELKMEVIVPLYHPQLPRTLGVRPMSGILLHGPPGCGKTKLAHAIANETGVPFYKISATELVSGISGASEENIRELFSKAYRTAPSIVFIDEIDAIASKRENLQREMERRIVTQLMTCMDESNRLVQPTDKHENSESSDCRAGYVLVIGATNRPDAVDAALRRPRRFDREIDLGFPDENARIEIFSVLIRNLKLEGAFDLVKIARSTPGFVGADLAALADRAGNLAMKRIIDKRKFELSSEPINGEHAEDWGRNPWSLEEMEKLRITMDDFEEIGVDSETGFLLFGPPGCGKTLTAKAVANEAGANFIHIKGPELLNKYVGESELAVRTMFRRAMTCSPCILFFDEVDASTTKRGKEGGVGR